MEPTRNSVDALSEKGMTIEQIAAFYKCSRSKIVKLKTRHFSAGKPDTEYRNPISPEELEKARQIQIGETVEILNTNKMKGNCKGIEYGVLETHKVVKKLKHLVLLDNGKTVDYAEIAMQRRSCAGNS